MNQNVVLRNTIVLCVYLLCLVLSVVMATLVGFDFEVNGRMWRTVLEAALWILPLKLLFLWVFGQFRGLLMFFRMPDLMRLFWASALPALVLLVLFFWSGTQWVYPRRIILLDFVFTMVGLASFRMLLRLLRERYLDSEQPFAKQVKVALFGAGDTAARIAAELLAKPGFGKRPVVFIDGDSRNQNRNIHGIKVISSKRRLKEIKESYSISEVLIANPHLSPAMIRDIRDEAVAVGLRVEIVPGFEVFLSGKMSATSIREISIEDLLPREETSLDGDSISQMLRGKTVLVTGAGGSIGSELCRQVMLKNPKRLLVVDQSEPALYLIERELASLGYSGIYVPIVADVCDLPRMEAIIDHYKPTILFHAAAHGSLIMLEDDLVVSRGFYRYAVEHMEFYANDVRVAGGSLFHHQLNETAKRPFRPIHDGSDVYLLQLAASWGQFWTRDQWRKFKKWSDTMSYEAIMASRIPWDIRQWPKCSWKKWFTSYLVENEKYVVYPRYSLSTNFMEPGENNPVQDFDYQTELMHFERDWRFVDSAESRAIYDAYCEIKPSILAEMNIRLGSFNFSVDTYGVKELESIDTPYLLTSKQGVRPILGFERSMKPEISNIILDLKGSDLQLFRTENAEPLSRVKLTKELNYAFGIPSKLLFQAVFEHFEDKTLRHTFRFLLYLAEQRILGLRRYLSRLFRLNSRRQRLSVLSPIEKGKLPKERSRSVHVN